MIGSFVEIAQHELAPLDIKFNFDLTYTGHFAEGSNPFEVLLAIFFTTIPFLLFTTVLMLGLYSMMGESSVSVLFYLSLNLHSLFIYFQFYPSRVVSYTFAR